MTLAAVAQTFSREPDPEASAPKPPDSLKFHAQRLHLDRNEDFPVADFIHAAKSHHVADSRTS